MTLLLIESLGAGLLFVGIIWWTMFSGRKNGELPRAPLAEPLAPETGSKSDAPSARENTSL